MDHVNYVLRNQYREQLGLQPGPHDASSGWMVTTSATRGGATARLDGANVEAVEIDTDPFVYAVGFSLREDVVVTSVMPRDELTYLELTFTTETPEQG